MNKPTSFDPGRAFAASDGREALHRGRDDLPFVELGDGSHLQLLQVDLGQGLWVVNVRFEPGCTIAKHYHTGPVFAVTASGSWHYLEYPDQINSAGSYLYEPAGSVHTLTAPGAGDGPTTVWFAVFGANVNLDENDQVLSITDAASVLGVYRGLCARAGLSSEGVIVVGAPQ
jgi:2,4'-dihydroxyacetophenone dioxygenase